MHLFFSAGEPSGDLHAANLARAILSRAPDAKIVGFGGPKLASAGVDLHYELTSLAIMWLSRSIVNLPTFFQLARQTEVYFRSKKPDALIVIDYPGFNFELAKRAHRCGIPVFYFVPPQLWAWAGWRVYKMQRWVDTVLTALPFEEVWYRERGVNTEYVGHPYFDELSNQPVDAEFMQSQRAYGAPIVAILPGSRNQEVSSNFELMVASAKRVHASRPDVRFLVASFNEKQAVVAQQVLAAAGFTAEVHVGRTPEIIELADACIAVSGSVSLEMMCRLKPAVIVYKINRVAKMIANQFMTCRYITLVNMLANEELYPEFLTRKDDSEAIAGKVLHWLNHPTERLVVVEKLRLLREKSAKPGACERAADYIVAKLK